MDGRRVFKQLPDGADDIGRMPVKLTVLLGSILLLSSACTRPAAGVCCTDPDDCRSIGTNDSERPCTMGLVCDMNHECSVPPVPPPPPPPPAGCQVDGDCGGITPFCATDHLCVGCLTADQCPASAPTCDMTTRSCRECATDDDCASAVCDLDTGSCVDTAAVAYASPTGSDTAACTQSDPGSISRAFALAVNPRGTVKLSPGAYTASITLTNSAVLVDGFGATVTAPSNAEPFVINGTSMVRMFGVAVVNNNTVSPTVAGIRCQDAMTIPNLALEQVSIDAAGIPLVMGGCNLTMSRSKLHARPGASATFLAAGIATVDRSVIDGGGSQGTGLLAEGGGSVVHVTNSVFMNLPKGAYLGGRFLPFGTTFGSIFVSFSTVVNSTIACGDGVAVCAGGTDGGACTDNSIVMNAGNGLADTITGAGCETNYSIVFPQSTSLGNPTNSVIDPLLADRASGDFHLKANSPAIDAANPTLVGTPDFDGIARPQGAHSDIGAFEFKP
jgi:hypothetical protein